jgi:hypothetical protein
LDGQGFGRAADRAGIFVGNRPDARVDPRRVGREGRADVLAEQAAAGERRRDRFVFDGLVEGAAAAAVGIEGLSRAAGFFFLGRRVETLGSRLDRAIARSRRRRRDCAAGSRSRTASAQTVLRLRWVSKRMP